MQGISVGVGLGVSVGVGVAGIEVGVEVEVDDGLGVEVDGSLGGVVGVAVDEGGGFKSGKIGWLLWVSTITVVLFSINIGSTASCFFMEAAMA